MYFPTVIRYLLSGNWSVSYCQFYFSGLCCCCLLLLCNWVKECRGENIQEEKNRAFIMPTFLLLPLFHATVSAERSKWWELITANDIEKRIVFPGVCFLFRVSLIPISMYYYLLGTAVSGSFPCKEYYFVTEPNRTLECSAAHSTNMIIICSQYKHYVGRY